MIAAGTDVRIMSYVLDKRFSTLTPLTTTRPSLDSVKTELNELVDLY
jgi:hypothetical protein